MKLTCIHADTCLPDYWSGHHLPHISIPAYPMSAEDLKRSLNSEVSEGAIAGAFDYRLLDSDAWYKKLHAAINRIECDAEVFQDVEPDDECYAYFVFNGE